MTGPVPKCDMALLCDMRAAIWPAEEKSSRGLGDWGQQATQWICNQMFHVKNGNEGLTFVGCKILTEILEHHLQSPSATFQDFFTRTMLPIVINGVSSHKIKVVDNDAYSGLIVAILKLLEQSVQRE